MSRSDPRYGLALAIAASVVAASVAPAAAGPPCAARAGMTPASTTAAASAATAPPISAPARRLRVERVEVEGNARVAERVVRRHAALAAGDPLDPAALARARRRLMATGYFRDVRIAPRRGSRPGDVVVRIAVDERPNPVFETGFGYHDLNGWFLTLVGLRLHNLLGDDSTLRLGLRLGFRVIGADLAWRKAIGNDARTALALRLSAYTAEQIFYTDDPALRTGTDPVSGYRQDVSRGTLELLLEHRLGARARIEAGLVSHTARPDSVFAPLDAPGSTQPADSLPSALRARNAELSWGGATVRFYRDTRDSREWPRRGSFVRATLDLYGASSERTDAFVRATIDARRFVAAGAGRVLALHVAAGATSRRTPYFERFYLGGNYSVRGYREWSLSPEDGDHAFWTASAELRLPLGGASARPRVVGLAFVDAGTGWQIDEHEPGDVFASAGWGLRVRLPWVGTLGLDAGVPWTSSPTGDPFRLHALVGFSF